MQSLQAQPEDFVQTCWSSLPGTHSHLKLTGLCDALPINPGARQSQEALFPALLRQTCLVLPTTPPPEGVEKLSPKLPPQIASGKYNAEPLYTQMFKSSRGILSQTFLSLGPGIAGGGGRRGGGNQYCVSGFTVSALLLSHHTLLLTLQIERKEQFRWLTSPVTSLFLWHMWMVHASYSQVTPPSSKSFNDSCFTVWDGRGEGCCNTRLVTGTGAGG